MTVVCLFSECNPKISGAQVAHTLCSGYALVGDTKHICDCNHHFGLSAEGMIFLNPSEPEKWGAQTKRQVVEVPTKGPSTPVAQAPQQVSHTGKRGRPARVFTSQELELGVKARELQKQGMKLKNIISTLGLKDANQFYAITKKVG